MNCTSEVSDGKVEDKRKKYENEKKFRDHKNRNLDKGESQRANGRYRYTYVGIDGKPHSVESWRLVPTDRLPAGKRPCKSLRELEKEIRAELDAGILPAGKKLTLNQLIMLQKETEGIKKRSTLRSDDCNIRFIKSDEIGNKEINSISKDYLKKWLKSLQQEKGKHYSSIYGYWKVIKKAFNYAEENDLVLKNPTKFEFSEYVLNDSISRKAVDTKVKESLLLFIKHHPKYKIYYEEVYLLFYSGVRVSELCGLTTNNLDFENKIINLDHQLQYDSHYGLYITSLKGRLSSSEVKTRSIPMFKGVFEALETIIRNRPIVDEEVIIQSEDPRIPAQSGFVILNQTGNPRYSKFYDDLFQDFCRDYNLMFPDNPIKITPHMCRHTFCTNIAEEGVDINLIQKLMGHTDVKTTQKYMKTFENQKVAEKTKYLNEKNW